MTDIELTADDLLRAKMELAALTGAPLYDIDGAVLELTGGERDDASQVRGITALAELVQGAAAPDVALSGGVPAALLPDGFAAWPLSEGGLPLSLTAGLEPGPDGIVALTDYSAEERREFAAKGWALADGSYPIANETDLKNAATLAKSGHGDHRAAARLIAKRAREMGVANPMDSGSGVAAAHITAQEAMVGLSAPEPWDDGYTGPDALTLAAAGEVERYLMMAAGEHPWRRTPGEAPLADEVDIHLAGIHARSRARGMGAVTSRILSPDIVALAGPQVSDYNGDGDALGDGHTADCPPGCSLYHDSLPHTYDVDGNPETLDPGAAQAEIDRIVSTYGSRSGFGAETPYSSSQTTANWVREADRSYSPAKPIR
jgi:hypothetical protein